MSKKFNIVLVLILISSNLLSQLIRIEDSVNCKVVTVYDNKVDSINEERDVWRFMINNCPESTKLTYINGEKIFKQLINKSKDSLVCEQLIDTLLLNYDMRLKYFGDSSRILVRKALAIMKYRKTDLLLAYELLDESIKLNPYDSHSKYHYFMLINKKLLIDKMILDKTYKENLELSIDNLEVIVEQEPFSQASRTLEGILEL